MDKAWEYALQAGGPAAVACLGWWLSGKFNEVRDDFRTELKKHEDLDDSRHDDNLSRFERINIQLARMQGTDSSSR